MEATKKITLAKELTLTSVFIAIGIVLPSVFHAFNLGGKVFLPMHIPVLMCGLLVGKRYGFLSGILIPLLSSILTGMPPIFPVAVIMSIELGTYGYVAGLLKDKMSIYFTLIVTQIIGRCMGALATFVILGFASKPFLLSTYMTSVFITALPGILIQLILIPIGIKMIQRAKNIN